MEKGTYTMELQKAQFPTGQYIVVLHTADEVITQKLILME